MMSAGKRLHSTPVAAVAHIDELLDEALKATFPASDAVAIDIENGSVYWDVPASLRFPAGREAGGKS
jgi:hypothetical protein